MKGKIYGGKKSEYSNLSDGIAKFSPLQSKLFSFSVNTWEEKLKNIFSELRDEVDDSITKLKSFLEWISCWVFSFKRVYNQ